MQREIIKQGDWGYGDVNGLAKEVDVGYRKWLKKNGLEPEGIKKLNLKNRNKNNSK
tara:strand:+ start:1144 stop:1311 length:168 start_codon:yes stop_codon:yes gene_type:complete